jgi:hypothetical protein
MSTPATTVDQNLLPVQAYFNLDGSFNTFIGQNAPFYASVNPIQSGLSITNSTINSTTIGATNPSTGVFTSLTTTTGSISTTPSNATDIVNKSYVDGVVQGYQIKQDCQVATTANITLSGLQTIDGYTTLAGDRVLVKNQATQANNGIYNASSGAWSRSADCATYASLVSAFTFVQNGTTQQNSGWACTIPVSGTLGVTAITFSQLSNATAYFAGTGLTLSSYTFSITPVGSAGTYGSASSVPVLTTNASGQVTSVTPTAISIANTAVSGLGTLSTQNANSVTITGGTINGTTIGATTAAAITGTTITGTSFSGAGTGLTGTATSLNIGGNAATATTATSAGSATTATTATYLAGGASNSLPYQSSANTTTFLASGTGVLQDNSGLSWTTSPSLVGTNFSSIPNSALTNSSITIGSTAISLGSTASTLTSVTMATPTISSYETYTGISAPSYNAGRLWYDSSINSLAYYNDVTNNTLHIGQEVQLKVYNNTGSTINIGQPVYITSTSSGFTYPNVALAIANSLTTSNVIGLANQAIPTATAGYITTIGLIQGVNTGTYTVGDTLYLSPYSAGFYQNTIPPTGYAIKVGIVSYVNASTGAIYVNKSNLSVQAGNIVGQVALANGGTNANLTAVAGGVVYSSASALAISAAGSSGQVLTSGGTGAPTWSTMTAYATVTDDTSTVSTRYPLFASQTSGNLTTEYTSSTNLQYVPSTGTLTALNFSGPLNGTVGATTASTGAFTTISATSVITSTLATGTAPFTVSSTTPVANLSIGGNAATATTATSAGSATTATTATNATNIAITDNTSSASTYYPVLSLNSSGNNAATTSSTKLSFVPNTGVLSATSFSGAVAATTLSASSTVSGTGFSTYLASPPAIGGTTAAAGSFTTLTASASVTSSGNKGAISYGTLGYSDTNILASFQSSVANYNQVVLQNTSNNAAASTNFNISNDAATATTNFGEFGINSSTFTGTGAFNAAGATYLASASTDLAIGTYGSNAIHFVVNSGATDAATISSAGLLTANSFASSSAAITGGSVNSTPIGATTASTGAFTTLSASSTVSGAGFSTYLASPPAIGGTAAAAGTFTALTATGTTTLATSLTGLLKATSGVVSSATAGTDYVAVGGALGTPSSGTVTNLTGTASININGTVGATTPASGSFTSLTATSVGTAGVLAKTGGKTAVTAISATTTLTTGGTTLASQTMASGSTWRVVAYGTFAAASSATSRTFTMACFWGSTQLTAITTGAVLASTVQTTPWKVEFEITGSSATAAWVTGFLSAQVTSATIPLNYAATAASTTGLTTTSTLDIRFANGTAAVDAINVQQVTIERLV